MNVKQKITMAEFGAIVDSVVNHCFESGIYDPTYRDFWTHYALISVFCDYPFGKGEDVNIDDVFMRIYDNDADDIDEEMVMAKCEISCHAAYDAILKAIERKIEYRNRLGVYSMTDMALTNLIDSISAKVDDMEEIFTAENVQALVDVSQKLSKLSNVSQKKIVSTIIDSLDRRNITVQEGK